MPKPKTKITWKTSPGLPAQNGPNRPAPWKHSVKPRPKYIHKTVTLKPGEVLQKRRDVQPLRDTVTPYEPEVPYYVPGTMFLTRLVLLLEQENENFLSHTFPYVTAGWPDMPGAIAHLSPAIYMGTLRVEESNKGKLVSVKRHVFLVGGTRMMSNDPGRFFVPVDLATPAYYDIKLK